MFSIEIIDIRSIENYFPNKHSSILNVRLLTRMYFDSKPGKSYEK